MNEVKYLSKLYLPENYTAVFQENSNGWGGFNFVSKDLNKLLQLIKANVNFAKSKYCKIDIINPDADEEHTILKVEKKDTTFALSLREHAKLRQIYFSPFLDELYGESFHIKNGNEEEQYVKIDYTYLYGDYTKRYVVGSIVTTDILAYEKVYANSSMQKYGRNLPLEISSNLDRRINPYCLNIGFYYHIHVCDATRHLIYLNRLLEFSFNTGLLPVPIPASTLVPVPFKTSNKGKKKNK